MEYYLLHTTYPVLFLCVVARQLCLPVPASLFLLSAGALAGAGRFGLMETLLIAVLGCLLGDQVWFEAGRRRGERTLGLLCLFGSDPSRYVRLARSSFERSGLTILLGTKFFPCLDTIVPSLAGMTGTSRSRFLAFDAAGATLWAGAYLGIGFVFAEQLDRVVRPASQILSTILLVLSVPLVICFVVKLVRLARMMERPMTEEIAVSEQSSAASGCME